MINDLINIIEGLGITLQQACYLSVIIYILSIPIIKISKKFFGGIKRC